jgi:FMN phosphatase YigB (HAD superfamily)
MIKLVITDLDNTIYNFVDFYGPSFRAMLDALVEITGLDKSTLKASFKRVHQLHRTSEYSFAIEELDVLAARDRALSFSEKLLKYNQAISAFRSKRAQSLRLYPGVLETLNVLRSAGKKIVAHTDAMMFYAVYRLQRQLNIGQLFDGLFAIKDHGPPPGVSEKEARSREPETYVCSVPIHRELNPSVTKPDPRVLKAILTEFSVVPHEAIYIGDSLHKDVRMAQLSGVHDVFAAYGRDYDAENWQLLVDITHWTDRDVAREKEFGAVEILPTHTIRSFPEVLEVISRLEDIKSTPQN